MGTDLQLRWGDADARVTAAVVVVCSMHMQAAPGLKEDAPHEASVACRAPSVLQQESLMALVQAW